MGRSDIPGIRPAGRADFLANDWVCDDNFHNYYNYPSPRKSFGEKKACPLVRVPVVQNLATHQGFLSIHTDKNKECIMNLTRASKELFRRTPDECFSSLGVLLQHTRWQKQEALEAWQPPRTLSVQAVESDLLMLDAGNDGTFTMNDWSFGQLCRLSGVAKETVNRLTPDTAARVFSETLPRGNKPLQLFTLGSQLRSVHAASYTRLYNADLLALIQDAAVGFEPPPKGFNGATGLYGGEQDMFCFLIDPTGWTEIGGESFCPGDVRLEQRGWQSLPRHLDVLVAGRLCKPYRLGCYRCTRVHTEAYRERSRGPGRYSLRDPIVGPEA